MSNVCRTASAREKSRERMTIIAASRPLRGGQQAQALQVAKLASTSCFVLQPSTSGRRPQKQPETNKRKRWAFDVARRATPECVQNSERTREVSTTHAQNCSQPTSERRAVATLIPGREDGLDFGLRPPAFDLRPSASGLRPSASASGLRPPLLRQSDAERVDVAWFCWKQQKRKHELHKREKLQYSEKRKEARKGQTKRNQERKPKKRSKKSEAKTQKSRGK